MLIEAFEDEECSKLESLNVGYLPIPHTVLDRLARCLSDPAKLPALRELEADVYRMGQASLASFREMLHANKTLQFVTLMGPFWNERGRS